MFWRHPFHWVDWGHTLEQQEYRNWSSDELQLMSSTQLVVGLWQSQRLNCYNSPSWNRGNDLRWSLFVTSWLGDSPRRMFELIHLPKFLPWFRWLMTIPKNHCRRCAGVLRSRTPPNVVLRAFPGKYGSVAAGVQSFSGDSPKYVEKSRHRSVGREIAVLIHVYSRCRSFTRAELSWKRK